MLSPGLANTKTFLKAKAPILAAAYRQLRRLLGLTPGRSRKELNRFIRKKTGSTVASGPFRGMGLVEGASWGDGDVAPKLLGVYEQELHTAIERVSARHYGAIVDIGCAEGYYAIGLAKRFPGVPVLAFDTDGAAVAIAERAASANDVRSRITFGGFCDHATLERLCAEYGRLLIVSDCEGYEVELFAAPRLRSALSRSDLIVECHDNIVPDGTERLMQALGPSHQVHRLVASGRNPNAFDFLAHLHEFDRWQAVCENRPFRCHWLFCEALTP